MANTASGQAQKVPNFKPAAVFFDGAGFNPFGVDAADAIGSDSTTPDGYPDVVFAIGQQHLELGNYHGLHGFLAVYRNTQNWATPANGLALFQHIDLGAETVPGEVEWADLTGDARLDIVVAVGTPYPDQGGNGPWGIRVYNFDTTTQNFQLRMDLRTPFRSAV
ncbi:MAG: hypothetical protein ACF8R9_15835 [Phycisphaerales bacterium JB054]